MSPPSDSLLQECTTCGTLLDVAGEEPFARMHCPGCGAAMRVRRHFDHFELQEEMGVGGMGTVYRALDTNLNRPVALKLLQRQHSGDPQFVAQFQKEAAITASINHPHVVKVYSTGCDHGLVYIAMELVDKGSLESLMNAQGRVAELQVLTIGIQTAQGLQAALERGLIHRDIKPGNVLFADPATAKIVDFGLAVLAEHAGTVAGEVWATPFYVSPETVESKPEDFRSDMYSLGATLYHALAGQPPHAVETNSMSELAAAKKAPVSLQAAAPGVSSTTAFVLNKVLSYDAQDRHASYAELIEHLEFARTELLATLQATDAAPVIARNWSWLTPLVALLVVAAGVSAHRFRDRLFPAPAPLAIAAETPPAPDRIATRYEEARRLLIANSPAKAAEAFAALDVETDTPQPLRNWITLHAGLAEMLAGRDEPARAQFTKIIERGLYSPDPAEQQMAKFFLTTARRASDPEVISPDAVRDLDNANYEAMQRLIYAVKNWSLGAYEEAAQLFQEFTAKPPQNQFAWIAEYRPLAAPYVARMRTFRKARDAAQSAATLEARERALQLILDARPRLRATPKLQAELDTFARDLRDKIAAEKGETNRRISATEAADARALAEAEAKIALLLQQFRPAEALAIGKAVQISGDEAQSARAALIKRLEWLAKFKATLIGDLNTSGYPAAVTRKAGGSIPGPVRRATDTQIETATPFATFPAPWTDLAAESIVLMAKSFLRADLPGDGFADRQWLLGVYALQIGRAREGRQLLIEASQAKEEYREELSAILENSTAP